MSTTVDRTSVVWQIARAITSSDKFAGCVEAGVEETANERADNLVRCKYVVAGDPYGWSNDNAIVTVLCEQRGYEDDCQKPFDYYCCPELPSSFQLADGRNVYFEWCNAAIVQVWEV